MPYGSPEDTCSFLPRLPRSDRPGVAYFQEGHRGRYIFMTCLTSLENYHILNLKLPGKTNIHVPAGCCSQAPEILCYPPSEICPVCSSPGPRALWLRVRLGHGEPGKESKEKKVTTGTFSFGAPPILSIRLGKSGTLDKKVALQDSLLSASSCCRLSLSYQCQVPAPLSAPLLLCKAVLWAANSSRISSACLSICPLLGPCVTQAGRGLGCLWFFK